MKGKESVLRISTMNGSFNTAHRVEMVNGVEFRVYPCVMMVEGVHQGVGSGPVFYSTPVLASSVANWNNLPVTVGHPVNAQGEHVLCNTDGTIRQQWEIGRISNAHMEDNKLKADLWINTRLAEQMSPELLPFISSGGQLEVSTGLLAYTDPGEGIWNEENFDGSVVDIIPDHLALLPNSSGACSWTDGCGVRFNRGKDKLVLVNEVELRQIMDKIYQHVDGLDVFDRANERYSLVNYVRAVYSDHFVYKQDRRSGDNSNNTTVLLKQAYSVDGQGTMTVQGDPVEVVETIEYTQKTNNSQAINNSTEENHTMADKKKCCEKRVATLVANEGNAFGETDQEWLTNLTEEQLDKVEAAMEPTPADTVVNKKEGSPEDTSPVKPSKADQLFSYLEEAPPAIRSLLNDGLKELDTRRTTLIASIMSNEGSKFTEDQLKAMDVGMLENISSLVPQPAPRQTFALRNPAHTVVNTETEEAPYVAASLSDEWSKKG